MIKAVWDALIIKADEKNEKVVGKWIVPDFTQERGLVGEIVEVGPGRWNQQGTARIPMSFKVGDRVIIPQIGFAKLEWEGKEYIAISEDKVLALIEE